MTSRLALRRCCRQTPSLMGRDGAFTTTRRKNTEEADEICSLTHTLLIFSGPNGKLSCTSMSAEQQKAPSVCVSASEAHDWSARPPARRSPPGKDGWSHDSFCNEGEKKKGSAHVREETAWTTGKLYGGAAWWMWN